MNHPKAPNSTQENPVELAEIDAFCFPTLFTAVFDYFATGEGMTVGIIMGYAQSAADLRKQVLDSFNPYYAQGADVWPNLRNPPGKQSLVPDAVRQFVADPTQVGGNFRYAGLFHLNRS